MSSSDKYELSDDDRRAVEDAYGKAHKIFGGVLVDGTHALPKRATLTLIELIQVKSGDVSWEIGCGSLELAYSLSCAADGGRVIAVDLSTCICIYFLCFNIEVY